jgi:hypothetical protein
VEQVLNEIRVGNGDKGMNALLDALGDEQKPFSRHFNQGEDFFLQLERPYSVPSFRIHHDVSRLQPEADYMAGIREVMAQVAGLAPQVLKGLSYFFDPSQILQPCFFRVYRLEERLYLYLVRIDLMMRASESTVLERGTNDSTPRYTCRRLFLEPTIIPLDEVATIDGRIQGFQIRQTISQTWIGEFGRGYFQQGIWMDADLTRFFSRLFLPAGKRAYPYFPYLCKYKTLCQAVISLGPESRTALVPFLHHALEFLLPELERIQKEMRNQSFSEQMEVFQELKRRVPDSWYEPWKGLSVESYLNEAERKEYRIED